MSSSVDRGRREPAAPASVYISTIYKYIVIVNSNKFHKYVTFSATLSARSFLSERRISFCYKVLQSRVPRYDHLTAMTGHPQGNVASVSIYSKFEKNFACAI